MELAEQNVCKCDTQMLDDSQNDSRSNEFSESMTSHHRHRHWLATLARMTNVEHSLFFDSQIRLDAYSRRFTFNAFPSSRHSQCGWSERRRRSYSLGFINLFLGRNYEIFVQKQKEKKTVSIDYMSVSCVRGTHTRKTENAKHKAECSSAAAAASASAVHASVFAHVQCVCARIDVKLDFDIG